jgi:C4-type Zn-finger protein
MLMVMYHNGWDRRCPYCLSRKLTIKDYDLASPQFKQFGDYWFLLACKKCGGECQDINNLESKAQRIAKIESRRKAREEQVNAEVSNK